jgi:hypothetical protein
MTVGHDKNSQRYSTQSEQAALADRRLEQESQQSEQLVAQLRALGIEQD